MREREYREGERGLPGGRGTAERSGCLLYSLFSLPSLHLHPAFIFRSHSMFSSLTLSLSLSLPLIFVSLLPHDSATMMRQISLRELGPIIIFHSV